MCNYEFDFSDYDWVDLGLKLFLLDAGPEVRYLFNQIIRKEGREKGIYIFNQVLAEIAHRLRLAKQQNISRKMGVKLQ